jgi:cation diffusion facilitator CzcD-associated flavoprotein CzcO
VLDWLVIGGGVHGTFLSRVLTGARHVAQDRIAVLDPHPEPLAVWDHCVAGCGMTLMRSPSVHNLDLEPFSLRRFSQRVGATGAFLEPYHRPHLALFRAHCDWVIERHGLRSLRRCGVATGLRDMGTSVRVETSEGPIEAAHVALAIGGSAQPRWPAWAVEARAAGAGIRHVFEPLGDDGERGADLDAGPVVIVGGGISAAQLAQALHERGVREVVVIARHAPRISAFDIDAGWLGPRFLVGFGRVADPRARREAISAARMRGSMPKETWTRLRRLIRRGHVRWVRDEVLRATPRGHGGRASDLSRDLADDLALDLASGDTLGCARVVLATGFEERRPGGAWLDDAIDGLGLPCSTCGYPLVDGALRWHPRIHVSGALAELEIGPAARNIAGARMAAERIAAVA